LPLAGCLHALPSRWAAAWQDSASKTKHFSIPLSLLAFICKQALEEEEATSGSSMRSSYTVPCDTACHLHYERNNWAARPLAALSLLTADACCTFSFLLTTPCSRHAAMPAIAFSGTPPLLFSSQHLCGTVARRAFGLPIVSLPMPRGCALSFYEEHAWHRVHMLFLLGALTTPLLDLPRAALLLKRLCKTGMALLIHACGAAGCAYWAQLRRVLPSVAQTATLCAGLSGRAWHGACCDFCRIYFAFLPSAV